MLFWGLFALEAPAPGPEPLPSSNGESRQFYSLEELEAMEMLPPLGFTMEVNVPAGGTIGFQVGAESGKQMVVINWNDPSQTSSHQVYNGMTLNGFYFENYTYTYPSGTGGLVQIEVMVCPTEVTTVQNHNSGDKGVVYGADISALSSLKRFSFHGQEFSTIDISGNTALQYLMLSGNQLSGTIDLSPAKSTLKEVQLQEQTESDHTSNHNIQALLPFHQSTLNGATAEFPNLELLNLTRNDIGTSGGPTNFYLDGCPKLNELWLQYNSLTRVHMPDVSILPTGTTHPLARIYCGVNQIDQGNGTWDFNNYPNLIDLHLSANQIDNVILNCASTLEELRIGGNIITSASFPDLSNYEKLRLLTAGDMNLNGPDTEISNKLPTDANWKLGEIYFFSADLSSGQMNEIIDRVWMNRCDPVGNKRLTVFQSGVSPSPAAQNKVDGNLNCLPTSPCTNTSCTLADNGWNPWTTNPINHPFYW